MFKKTALSVRKFLLAAVILAPVLVLMIAQPTQANVLEGIVDVNTSEEQAVEQINLLDSSSLLKRWADTIGLRDFSDVQGPTTVNEAGLDQITGFTLQLVRLIQYLLAGMAVLFLAYACVRLVSATDNGDEVYGQAKKQFLYITIALLLTFALDVFITRVFVLGQQNFLDSVETAQRFAQVGSQELRGIYTLLTRFLGGAAVLVVVFHGVRLVTNAGQDDVTENARRNIIWGGLGLILVGVADFVIRQVFFVDDGQGINLENFNELVVNLTNFASGFIATVAIIILIYAGFLYAFSTVGDDSTDKVKQMVVSAIIGLLIAGGSFAIVNTFIRLETPAEIDAASGVIDNI